MIRRIISRLKGPEKKFRQPRIWSNRELEKFAGLFEGKVINVSGWKDVDKEGKHYKDYFYKSSEYWISNYSDSKGLQQTDNEVFLDLEKEAPEDMHGKYDVVFNHTVLEHIYNCKQAFKNLCLLSKDVVIVVVPYIQQIHGEGYMDYWRFTPHSLKKMYEENGFNLRYCSANGKDKSSIYLFAIGYKDKKWDSFIPERFDLTLDGNKKLYGNNYKNIIGGNVVS